MASLIYPTVLSGDLKNILRKRSGKMLTKVNKLFQHDKKVSPDKDIVFFSAKQAKIVYIVRRIIFGRQKTIPITFPPFKHSGNVFYFCFHILPKTLSFSPPLLPSTFDTLVTLLTILFSFLFIKLLALFVKQYLDQQFCSILLLTLGNKILLLNTPT